MMLGPLRFYFLVVAFPTLHGFLHVQAIQSPRGGSLPPHSTFSAPPPAASWSSYANVDPSTIISLLVQKAGFFLDPKLRSLADLLHCDQARLNVLERELEVYNFTVSLPDYSDQQQQQHSLRIGRIHVTWDSYTQPCLEMEVEDVDVLVEFSNLIFTRNNWNELGDLGFPPDMIFYNQSFNQNSTSAARSEFVRIGSLDLQGSVVLRTRSRPLQKPIANDIVMNLQTIQDLKYEVQAMAEFNEREHGRRGCTSEEMYDIFREFFNAKIKQAIRYAVEDLAASQLDPTQGSRLVNNSKQVLSSAKEALLAYATNVESISKDAIKEKLKSIQGELQDADILIKDEEVDQLISGTLDALKGTVRSFGAKVWQSISQPRNASGANSGKGYLDEDEILFPDW